MECNYSEQPVTFSLDGHDLYGIYSVPEKFCGAAVIIVVGGPQYRVGSHRQFVLLARHLANHGVLALRFDYSGIGYSEGFHKEFYEIDRDISAALDHVVSFASDVKKIFVWGLCDAASAIAFYAHTDKRIDGVILLNPWIRSEDTRSKTLMSNYYRYRFIDIAIWKDLLKSPIKILVAIRSLLEVLSKVVVSIFRRDEIDSEEIFSASNRANNIIAVMLAGLSRFNGDICIVLSENDLTAREFEEGFDGSEWLAEPENKAKTTIHRVDEAADHTFSSAKWRSAVEQITLEFVAK